MKTDIFPLHPSSLERERLLEIFDPCAGIDTASLLREASKLREQFFGRKVQIHIINNLRNGHCPEDCRYCAQRRISKKDQKKDKIDSNKRNSRLEQPTPTPSIEVYTDKTDTEILSEAKLAFQSGAFRYCLVSSGRGPDPKSVNRFARLIQKIHSSYPSLEICLSAGILKDKESASLLRKSGLNRYNHNLNTSQTHYPEICKTHTYQDRLDTLETLRLEGINLCSGIIVGMGESLEDRISVALELRSLQVASIPVNFFLPVPGNSLQPFLAQEDEKEEASKERKKPKPSLSQDECLRTLALFRLLNPRAEIRIAAGREFYLQDRQIESLSVANSLFVSGYLNVKGSDAFETTEMILRAGYEIESASSSPPDLAQSYPPSEKRKKTEPNSISLKTKEELRPFHVSSPV